MHDNDYNFNQIGYTQVQDSYYEHENPSNFEFNKKNSYIDGNNFYANRLELAFTRYEYFFVPMIYNILYNFRKFDILDTSILILNNYLMSRVQHQIIRHKYAILTRSHTDKLFFSYEFVSR